MSHSNERKEKVCLNCKAFLYGRYCHACGQENIEPKESFIGLITHFFYDITHFDGNFFSTVKYLLFKPGFLPSEYIKGRRARYLHPIRMYLFTSALFFIIFFAKFNIEEQRGADTSNLKNFTKIINQQVKIEVDKQQAGDTLTKKESNLNLQELNFTTKAAYDSAQKLLPVKDRDGWLKRTARHKQIEIIQKFERDPNGMFYVWAAKFIHMFPQLLFVSLPIFALILTLLYWRKKQFYYADHAIFSIHLYIFAFIAMLIYFLFTKLYDILHWRLLNYLTIGIVLYMVFYAYLAMRKFYQQGRFKTFVKYFLLSFMSFIVLLILFVSFILLSIFQI